MKRVSSGIKGLDKLIQGGFPEKSSIVLCGGPGTGKSIFGLQFLWEGVQKGENGLYVSIEEKPQNLLQQAVQFGWNFAKYKNRVSFLKVPIDEANVDIMSLIEKEAKRIKAQRVVLDSLSILAINGPMYRLPIKVKTKARFARTEIQPSALNQGEETQQFIYIFVARMSDLGATTLFIADSPQAENYLTRDTVSEFACDGLIQVKLMEMGKTVNRTVEIKKMRKTKIVPGLQLLDFSKDGLVIKPFEY
ncbi:hypothetical protein JW968_00890 [Candidatus Woesearchaeota archaeon]|nr:hypothetical protein [Candidatus Woesearchaeota archaeon]